MRIAIDWAERGRQLAILVGIGTFLSILNPFNAGSSLPFWAVWCYWTGLVIYGSVIGWGTATLALKWLDGLPIWLILAVIAAVCALFVTPVLIILQHAFGGRVPLDEYPRVYGLALVISIGITIFGYLLDRAKNGDAAAEGVTDETSNPVATFMSRLPLPYRNADLYAISSEDHYLRVHTSAGEHLFLERLSTAMHQLERASGLQAHRSWWVNETGVKSVTTSSGKMIITLKSDVEVPVSRTFAPKVREAGWLG